MSLVPAPQRQERPVVIDANPMLDTGRFEQIARIAGQIAVSGMAPESITHYGPAASRKELDLETVRARCFLIVEQAVRWNMPAFAVISACSLVHGKLCYEGKLVAAVLESKLGVSLDYEWDDKTGDQAGIVVSGMLNGKRREIRGTVADWKPAKSESWGTPTKNRKMLANRGTREWARLWAPAVLLGVYTNDEMEDLQEAARDTRRARNGIAPPPPAAAIEHRADAPVDIKVNTATEPAKEEPKVDGPAPRAEMKPGPSVSVQPDQSTDKPRRKAPPPAVVATSEAAAPELSEEELKNLEHLEAVLQDWLNVASSCESLEELTAEAAGFNDLFGVEAPPSIRTEAEKIRDAEAARIERQG